MKEFKAHLGSSASMKIFPQNTLSSFKIFLKEKFNLEGDWRVALSKIIFPAKINRVNIKELKIFSSDVLKFYEKNISVDAV